MFSGLALETVAILTCVAFAAGLIDALAGGGGLLALPALLLAGLDPVQALGTNKAQAVFGSGSSTLRFTRKGMIDWKRTSPMALMALIGGALGAVAVNVVPRGALQAVMPIFLIVIALFFIFSKRVSDDDADARLSPMVFSFTAALGLGFYDGVFGPGTGSFLMLAFVTLLGYGVRRATAHTKLLNFGSNIGSLAVFSMAGAVLWPLGLVMGAAQFAGAQVGAHLALKHGASLIRPLLVLISLAIATRLLLDPTNPLRVFVLSLFN